MTVHATDISDTHAERKDLQRLSLSPAVPALAALLPASTGRGALLLVAPPVGHEGSRPPYQAHVPASEAPCGVGLTSSAVKLGLRPRRVGAGSVT
jgi:hypothetical protein